MILKNLCLLRIVGCLVHALGMDRDMVYYWKGFHASNKLMCAPSGGSGPKILGAYNRLQLSIKEIDCHHLPRLVDYILLIEPAL